MYDWSAFLKPHFKKIVGIKEYHHFIVKQEEPEKVILQQYGDSKEETFKIVKEKWKPTPAILPSIIPPPGLSAERQWYLYDHIRDYCTPSTRDTLCPLPTVARPGEVDQPDSTPTSPLPPSAKRPRFCSVCGESGHNARRHNKKMD